MQTAVVFIGMPLAPIIKCIVSTRKQNLDGIEAWESLNSHIDSSLEKLKKNQKSINESALYRILGTYHYRKTAFKIPEWLYNRMRNRQEEKLIRWLVNFRIKDIKKETPNFTFWRAKLSVNLVKTQIIKWYCGERGIRTPGASRHAGFQDRCNRPLYHLSKEGYFSFQRKLFLLSKRNISLFKEGHFSFCAAKVQQKLKREKRKTKNYWFPVCFWRFPPPEKASKLPFPYFSGTTDLFYEVRRHNSHTLWTQTLHYTATGSLSSGIKSISSQHKTANPAAENSYPHGIKRPIPRHQIQILTASNYHPAA